MKNNGRKINKNFQFTVMLKKLKSLGKGIFDLKTAGLVIFLWDSSNLPCAVHIALILVLRSILFGILGTVCKIIYYIFNN